MDDAIITSQRALLPFQSYNKLAIGKIAKKENPERNLGGAHTPDAIFVFLTKRWEKREFSNPITPTAIPPPS